MTKLKYALALTCSIISFVSCASIEGNTFSIHRAFPTTTQDYIPPILTTMETGSNDAVLSQYTTVDIELDKVTFELNLASSSEFVGNQSSTFDGHVVRGFGGNLLNAEITHSDFSFANLTFDGDAIYINLGGSVGGTARLEVAITIAQTPDSNSIDVGKITRIFAGQGTSIAIKLDSNFSVAMSNEECPAATKLWAGLQDMNANMMDTIIHAKESNANVSVVTNGCEGNWLKLDSITVE